MHPFKLLIGGAAPSESSERHRTTRFDALLGTPAFAVTTSSAEDFRRNIDASDSKWPEAARASAPEPGEEFSLAKLWAELLAGSVRIVDHFYTDERVYLVLEEQHEGGRVSSRQAEVLRRLLLGEAQKVVAMDLRVAVSTVASIATDALRIMGLDSSAHRAPPLLAMAARAHSGYSRFVRCRRTTFFRDTRTYSAFCAERPDALLAAMLPPAECVVTQLLIEGRSYREIAALRGTSQRTIANQVAASFRKLGVSGRAELLSTLIRGWEARGYEAETETAERRVDWTDRPRLVSGVA